MKNKKAFTLVELLIVIAIIGVLAGLLFPALASIMSSGAKTTAQNNGKQIASSWMTNKTKISGNTEHEWAASLAKASPDYNKAEFWILPDDPKAQAVGMEFPTIVLDINNGVGSVNADFEQFPLMWAIASKNQGNGTTPLLWTRGLQSDGTWSETEGVFAGEGGHIVYTDGSVKWYETLKKENGEGELLPANQRKSTKPTFNIKDAIPSSCTILNGAPSF